MGKVKCSHPTHRGQLLQLTVAMFVALADLSFFFFPREIEKLGMKMEKRKVILNRY